MIRKNYKMVMMLLICGVFLASTLLIGSSAFKQLGEVDSHYLFYCKYIFVH